MSDRFFEPPIDSREISPDEYWPISSDYLRNTRRTETWHINKIHWNGDTLMASARLEGCEPSSTDGHRSHASIYSIREMDAQFAVIGIHLKMGLKRKSAEVWLLRCEEECMRAITDLNDVRFEMRFFTKTTSSGKTLVERETTITDSNNGLIKLQSKSLISTLSP